jgi:hypothetical protein
MVPAEVAGGSGCSDLLDQCLGDLPFARTGLRVAVEQAARLLLDVDRLPGHSRRVDELGDLDRKGEFLHQAVSAGDVTRLGELLGGEFGSARGSIDPNETVAHPEARVEEEAAVAWSGILATLTGAVLLPGTAVGDVAEVWSLDGFKTPESALFDAERGVIYVSNVAGEMTGKDGAGHISRVSPTGEMLDAEWVSGLNAPKGLALDAGTLYVSDIDRLVAIDVEAGEISGEWPAEGAQFLNDTAVDGAGRVFVSDMVQGAIYVMENDAVSLWLADEALDHPNGLKIDGERLVIAPWGAGLKPDFTTERGGYLLALDLATKAIAPLGAAEPVGNLDGLEPVGAGTWLTTDWIQGGLYQLGGERAERLHPLGPGSADLGFVPDERLAVVPMMLDDRVVAYRVE